jgi:hypothetical protein
VRCLQVRCDQTPRPTGQSTRNDLLPHFPCHRDHHLFTERWYN